MQIEIIFVIIIILPTQLLSFSLVDIFSEAALEEQQIVDQEIYNETPPTPTSKLD